MLQIAIVEDDDQEAKVLNDCLNKYAQEHKNVFSIQRFSDGAAFLSAEKAVFDLVFMDVEMPFMDGLKTAEKLREKDSQTVLVFVTKLFQYAVNGYDMDTNRVYAWQSDRNTVAIDCTAVENVEAENLYQRSELDYLIWNDPTAYGDMILNGNPQEYMKVVTAYGPEQRGIFNMDWYEKPYPN